MPPSPIRWRRARRADDTALWHRATRDVTPLRAAERRALEPDKPRQTPPASSPSPTPQVSPTPPGSPPEAPLDSLAGIDRANAERLKRGRRPIEARLDLPGLTQAEAYRALARFVLSSHAAGRRCVLVITGRGRLGGGVLRAVVPRWLAEPELRRHLLGIAPAQPQHGGAGAFYVLLRRLRQP